MIKFFADECLHTDLIFALRDSGHDVLTVKQAGLVGTDDEGIYEFAKENGRVLLTFDRGFGDIFRFDIAKSFGVIIVRIGNMNREEIIRIVTSFFAMPEKPDFSGKLVIISKGKVRISGK